MDIMVATETPSIQAPEPKRNLLELLANLEPLDEDFSEIEDLPAEDDVDL